MLMPGGFPIGLFVDTPPVDLLCGFCKNILNNPHQCKNGHLFCLQCLQTCTECPTCKISLNHSELGASLLAQERIETLSMKCRCKVMGSPDSTCSWTGLLKELTTRECPFELRMCPNVGCRVVCGIEPLKQHNPLYQKRLVECDLCSLNIPQTNLRFTKLSSHSVQFYAH